MVQALTNRQITILNDEWTFLDVSTKKYTHAIHLYPARMHPHIANKIITKYSKSTDVVFDPFMGSGGVLLEAMLHGNRAIGLDINPFAVLLSKVKTTPITKDLYKECQVILDRLDTSEDNHTDFIPTSYDVKRWFRPETVKTLAILKQSIWNIRSVAIRDFFKICFALTVRKASYQRNSAWKIHRLPEDQRDVFRPDPIAIFSTIVRSNITHMRDFVDAKPSGTAYPVLGDTREITTRFSKLNHALNDSKVNLVITSPPYGDHKTTVAYGQFSKHAGHWLDLPHDQVTSVDKIGLGGNKYNDMDDLGSETLNKTLDKIHKNEVKMVNGKTPYRDKEAYAFFFDLDLCLEQLSQNMASGSSHACFVVANRTVRRVIVPMDKILIELGEKYGFSTETVIYRDIPNKSMPSKNAPENITNQTGKTMTRETIIVTRC